MKKKLLSLVLSLVMCLSLCIPAFAANNSSMVSSSQDIVGEHTLDVGNKSVNIFVTENNGRYTVTTDYDLHGSDALQVINAIKTYSDSLFSPESVISPNGWSAGWDEFSAACYGNNGDAHLYSVNKVKFYHDGSRPSVTANGSLEGYWMGSGTPSFVQLAETLTVSGATISVSWPASFSVSGSKSSASYTSEPFTNMTYGYQPYNNVYAFSRTAIYSFTQSDSATVRVGGTDYRTNCTIYTNWLTGECTTNPNGNSSHTNG